MNAAADEYHAMASHKYNCDQSETGVPVQVIRYHRAVNSSKRNVANSEFHFLNNHIHMSTVFSAIDVWIFTYLLVFWLFIFTKYRVSKHIKYIPARVWQGWLNRQQSNWWSCTYHILFIKYFFLCFSFSIRHLSSSREHDSSSIDATTSVSFSLFFLHIPNFPIYFLIWWTIYRSVFPSL